MRAARTSQRVLNSLVLAALLFFPRALRSHSTASIPEAIHLQILKAEDERVWDSEIEKLLSHENAAVRRRAALAAGRIGDTAPVPKLNALLRTDRDINVRAMAAFALGETRSEAAARGLLNALVPNPPAEASVYSRIVEGIGKCAAALPKADDSLKARMANAVVAAFEAESRRLPQPEREVTLAAVTAAIRAKPPDAGKLLAKFLEASDAHIRADAANALARLRLKDGGEALRTLLANDADAVVRANAARALGAAGDTGAVDLLLSRVTHDPDVRVRVSAVRALGSIGDKRAAEPLRDRAEKLFVEIRGSHFNADDGFPAELNELTEMAAALGKLLTGTNDTKARELLRSMREPLAFTVPEFEIALAQIAGGAYLDEKPFKYSWSDETGVKRAFCADCTAATTRGLQELAGRLASMPEAERHRTGQIALRLLRSQIEFPPTPRRVIEMGVPGFSIPDAFRAVAAYKPNDLRAYLLERLSARGVWMRSMSAELLATLPPGEDARKALGSALAFTKLDTNNDAALAILDALAKQKSPEAFAAIRSAVEFPDYIVRRRAISLLREAGQDLAGLSAEPVKSRNTPGDYKRALARIGKRVEVEVQLHKGSFILELFPEEAPLTVDNFVQLVRDHFFDNVTFHRVVPNFVVQSGDPSGTGNGGPGWQIRCEINMVTYEQGTLGMALSGKDTGGSQWFITHSPQPHLDGGYTAFGRVIRGMDVVDRITRGDRLRRMTVRETSP